VFRYVSNTSIGLFEQTNAALRRDSGTSLGGKREMSRATTAESALETIYDLAGVKPPVETDDETLPGAPAGWLAPKARAAVFLRHLARRDRGGRIFHTQETHMTRMLIANCRLQILGAPLPLCSRSRRCTRPDLKVDL